MAERIKVLERIVTGKRYDLKRATGALQGPENWHKKTPVSRRAFFYINLAFSRRPLREMPELLH